MCSDDGNQCSHWLGSPIRIFPDHRLLAPPRDFSQLATSFFAYLRQGIPTHALSSLTIKLTSYTEFRSDACLALPYLPNYRRQVNLLHLHWIVHSNVMPVRYSVVKDRICETNRIPFSGQFNFKRLVRPIGREILETSSQNPEGTRLKQVENTEIAYGMQRLVLTY
jgi:hypothetical protein